MDCNSPRRNNDITTTKLSTGNHVGVPLELTVHFSAIFSTIDSTYGRLDILINNAGKAAYNPLRETFEVNVVRTHYSDVILSAMVSQITGVLIVCSTVCSGADQIKHQSSTSLAFVRGIHRWPHKGPVTRICFHIMTSLWIAHGILLLIFINKKNNWQLWQGYLICELFDDPVRIIQPGPE